MPTEVSTPSTYPSSGIAGHLLSVEYGDSKVFVVFAERPKGKQSGRHKAGPSGRFGPSPTQRWQDKAK